MTMADTIGLSLRNLRQAKLRSGLTTLGVSIGIASLAGMVSLGVGLQDQVVGRFLQSGVFDAITVASPGLLGVVPAAFLSGRGGLRGARGRGAPDSSAQPSAPKLDDNALNQIARLDNVREVYPNLRLPLEMTFGEFSRPVFAASVPMSAKGDGAFQSFAYGRFFTSESGNECMLNLNIAKQIVEQDAGSLIDKNLTLSYAAFVPGNTEAALPGFQVQRVNVQCRIVGIVERDPNPLPIGGGQPAALMLPLGLAKTIDAVVVTNTQSLLRDRSQTKSYDTVTVKVKQAQVTQDVEDRLRGLGYTAFSVNDALRGAKNAFILLDITLSLIGSIALAVSSLGIVNTMVMSILERPREIGIMKAIGTSCNDIPLIFLLEPSCTCLLSG